MDQGVEAYDTREDSIHLSRVTATAVASPGRLGAMAFADKPAFPCDVMGYFLDSSIALATATFEDTLIINGPPGTLVGLRFTSVLTGSCSPDVFQSYRNCSGGLDAYVSGSVYGTNANIFSQRSYNRLPPEETSIAYVPAGAVLNLRVVLFASAGATTDDLDVSDALADFLNTGRFYADVLTSGASLVSGTGHNYSVLVPEPSTLELLGVAIVGLGAARRRRTPPRLT